MYIYSKKAKYKMSFQFNDDLLKSVFETSKLFMGIFDNETGRFVYINGAGFKLLKISGLNEFDEAFPNGIRKVGLTEEHMENIATQIQKNSVFEEEQLFKNSLGEEFWGNLQISNFNFNGKNYYYIILADISIQKLAEQHEKDQELRFEALFMHAAIGIIMVDKPGNIVLSNHFANNIFGYETAELLGKKLSILIPENVRKSHELTHEIYTENPQPRPMGVGLDLKGQKKDGSLFPLEISLSHFKSGDTPYYISFINDVTFKRKAEESLISTNSEIKKLNENLEREVVSRTNALVETLRSLEKSKKELEIALNKEKELGELKSRFVSMASHEFRTPLTSIQSAASLIEKYDDKDGQEKREKHTHRIKAAVGNLTDILEEFLSVGKLEEGKVEIKLSIFDLKELIEDCRMDLKSTLKLGQSIEYQHIGEDKLNLDKSIIRKIIINLCSNAIKFSPPNSTIYLTTEINEKSFYLKVKDNGIGISEDDQKHLFDRFFRGANVTNIQGTGLGLHIVARYVQLLNGKISLKSELDKGTELIIEIDLRNVNSIP
jgi:PAS domain S-box-containing protein